MPLPLPNRQNSCIENILHTMCVSAFVCLFVRLFDCELITSTVRRIRPTFNANNGPRNPPPTIEQQERFYLQTKRRTATQATYNLHTFICMYVCKRLYVFIYKDTPYKEQKVTHLVKYKTTEQHWTVVVVVIIADRIKLHTHSYIYYTHSYKHIHMYKWVCVCVQVFLFHSTGVESLCFKVCVQLQTCLPVATY